MPSTADSSSNWFGHCELSIVDGLGLIESSDRGSSCDAVNCLDSVDTIQRRVLPFGRNRQLLNT